MKQHLIAAALCILCALTAHSAEIQIGQPAPAFSLPDQNGVVHTLRSLRGRSVVLAFYPKDFTGG